jgi:RsiW-degrading membrane proteinase PrsW (M82 family)
MSAPLRYAISIAFWFVTIAAIVVTAFAPPLGAMLAFALLAWSFFVTPRERRDNWADVFGLGLCGALAVFALSVFLEQSTLQAVTRSQLPPASWSNK